MCSGVWSTPLFSHLTADGKFIAARICCAVASHDDFTVSICRILSRSCLNCVSGYGASIICIARRIPARRAWAGAIIVVVLVRLFLIQQSIFPGFVNTPVYVSILPQNTSNCVTV